MTSYMLSGKPFLGSIDRDSAALLNQTEFPYEAFKSNDNLSNGVMI